MKKSFTCLTTKRLWGYSLRQETSKERFGDEMETPKTQYWVIDLNEKCRTQLPDKNDTVSICIREEDMRKIGNYAPAILIAPLDSARCLGHAIQKYLRRGVVAESKLLICDGQVAKEQRVEIQRSFGDVLAKYRVVILIAAQ